MKEGYAVVVRAVQGTFKAHVTNNDYAKERCDYYVV